MKTKQKSENLSDSDESMDNIEEKGGAGKRSSMNGTPDGIKSNPFK